MKPRSCLTRMPLATLLSAAWAAAGSARETSGVTPVQKAVEMLQGMLVQAKQGRQEERVQYAGFKQFCDDTTLDRQRAVQSAEERIETLKAHILKHDTEAVRLGNEVAAHNGEIVGWSKDGEAADSVRSTERTDYDAMHRNFTESIHALGKAISTLKAQAYDRSGKALLLQRAASTLAGESLAPARRAIEAFLARSSEDPDLAFSPPTTAYEFRSTDVVTMLEGLETKFKTKLAELEKEEVARGHAYDSLKQDLSDSIKVGKSSIKDKTKAKELNQQNSVEKSATLQDVTATMNADKAYLADLVTTCEQKASDFDSRQKLRGEEIEALTKAVDILSSSSVAGAAEMHLPAAAALLSKDRVVSFAQLRANVPADKTAAQRLQAVADLLTATSTRTGSSSLSALAMRAQSDPLAKVKKLIEELLARLVSQATEEAEHKGWCDTELGTNKHTRETKTEEVELLTSMTEKLRADIAKLKTDVSDLSKAVEELDKDMAKETELRNKEKARNEQTIQEARDGQSALSEAITVLKKFYSTASEATSLVQGSDSRSNRQSPAGAPHIFDEAYKGLQDQTGGVLGMLEVIQADFLRLEKDTESSEKTATQEYDKFMEDSSVDKTQKQKDIEHMTRTQSEKEEDLMDKTSSLESAGRALEQAQESFEKLKPACLDTGMTYAERKSRREDELEALKEALEILSGVEV